MSKRSETADAEGAICSSKDEIKGLHIQHMYLMYFGICMYSLWIVINSELTSSVLGKRVSAALTRSNLDLPYSHSNTGRLKFRVLAKF
ncbi:MAG: hypothetical protein WB988_27335 [Candidatus Nitrosopolaris sp.]|jgi:hypothetical protein